MHWTDLLIIYLSCGAPFGVHFFLQNRKKYVLSRLLLSSGAAGLFWIAYAYLLWRKNLTKRLIKNEISYKNPEISLLEQQTSVLQEQILQAFVGLRSESELNFFAFRDVLERYTGLTLVLKADALKAADAAETIAGEIDFEVFRIAGRKKKELPLAGKCLARKNSIRLKSHQCNAREDFLKQLAILTAPAVQVNGNGKAPGLSLFRDLILELFDLIDVKTLPRVQDLFDDKTAAPGAFIGNSENGFHIPEVISCQPPSTGPSRSTQPTHSTQMPPLHTHILRKSSAE